MKICRSITNVHRTKEDTILAYSPGILAGEIPAHVLHTRVMCFPLMYPWAGNIIPMGQSRHRVSD